MKIGKKYFCPKCKANINAATEVSGQELLPESGDICICVYCSTVLVFQINKFKLADHNELAGSDLLKVSRAQRISKCFRAAKEQ